MKETSKSYYIGIVNGIVFTFAFLFLLIGMDEEFHFMDNGDNSEGKLTVDTIISDLSMFDEKDVEKEYLNGHSPEHILDVLLHQYSMVGTIWEEKWNHLSDLEKVKMLLDTLKKEDTSEKESDDVG